MTTDELFRKLPSHIGRNKILDDDGKIIAYVSDDNQESADMGWLYLHNDGRDWCASYCGETYFGLQYVCLNPDKGDDEPFYNNAFAYGSSPNETLHGLYDWCVKNGFINEAEDDVRFKVDGLNVSMLIYPLNGNKPFALPIDDFAGASIDPACNNTYIRYIIADKLLTMRDVQGTPSDIMQAWRDGYELQTRIRRKQ